MFYRCSSHYSFFQYIKELCCFMVQIFMFIANELQSHWGRGFLMIYPNIVFNTFSI